MSNVQEQLFEAIDIITRQRIDDLKIDKTVEAVITDSSKAETGEYKAKFQDVIITVFSNSNTIKYDVEDAVMVHIPGGDFGKKKTILSTAGLRGENFLDLEDFPSGGDLIDKMGYNFVNEDKDFTITLPTNAEIGERKEFRLKAQDMITYFPRKKVIIFGMNLYTNIDINDVGDYGLAIEMTFMDEKGESTQKIFKTQLIDIIGNPYQSNGYKEVKVRLPEKLSLVSVNKAYAYVEGFKLGKEENIVRFSELDIQYGTIKDTENVSEYSGNILAPKGTIFKSSSLFPTERLSLIMEVKKQGVQLINNSELSYMWFEIDEDITNSTQDGYHPEGGYGWRWIKEDIEGLTGVTTSEVEIEAKFIKNFSSFKCIAKYKDFSVNSNIVSVVDNTDELTTTIESSNGYSFKNGVGTTELDVEVKKNGEAISKDKMLFKWIRISETGVQTVLRFNGTSRVPIDISTIGNRSSFICEVYKEEDSKNPISKGSTSLVVVYDAPTYGLSVSGGFRSVLYDKDGKAPTFTPSQFNYTLFKNGEAVTKNITQKWTIPNPTTTMLTMETGSEESDGSISSNAKEIALGVLLSFDLKKMDNYLKLVVYHTENDVQEVFTEFVPISITKVGETGANGAAGSQGVDGNSYVYEVQNGTRAISYDKNGLVPTPPETESFSLVFYKNGTDITSELNSVTWSLPSESLLTFKGSDRPKTLETKDGKHSVVLEADDNWDESKFNNVLKAEFKYNNITFREYSPITITKNAKDGQDGASGNDAYTVMLTNENHTFPAGKDGGLLVGGIKISVIALKGTSPATYTVDKSSLPTSLEYFKINEDGGVISIDTVEGKIPPKDSGGIDIKITVDNRVFIKTFTWSLARRGVDGESAKYVVLAGEQIFSCSPGYTAPYSPNQIGITSTTYGIPKDSQGRVWTFKRAGEEDYRLITNEVGHSLIIKPDDYDMWKNATSISLRCSVDGYMDEMTIAKVANGLPGTDGSDGVSPYIILLVSSNGIVFKDGIVDTVITATIMKGEEEVAMTTEIRNKLFWEKIDKNGNITSTQEGTFSPSYVNGQKEKIRIGSSDIIERATFNCGLLD